MSAEVEEIQAPGAPVVQQMSSAASYVPVIADLDEAQETQVFTKALREVVPDRFATQYAASLVSHSMNSRLPPETVSSQELQELGIRIGHRAQVLEVLATMRRTNLASFSPPPPDPMTGEEQFDKSDHTTTAIDCTSNTEPVSEMVSSVGTLKVEKTRYGRRGEWINWSGTHNSLSEFLTAMKLALELAEMPPGFLRMFLDNKPMPYAAELTAPNGRVSIGMLLRVPLADMVTRSEDEGDLLLMSTNATTLHDIANRLVVLYQPATPARGPKLFTYRKDQNLPLINELLSETDEKVRARGVDYIAVRLLRGSMNAYREPLVALRQEFEVVSALPDSYRTREVVKTLSRINRQAAVIHRCLTGNEKVLKNVSETVTLEDQMKTVIQCLEDLKEVADELKSNADDMFNLRLTMIDFKTAFNMRIFTNMTVVLAPMGVITGWFGMNFVEMEELSIPGFYYGVVAFAVCLMLSIIAWLFYINRDRKPTSTDIRDAQRVLSKAEGEDDD